MLIKFDTLLFTQTNVLMAYVAHITRRGVSFMNTVYKTKQLMPVEIVGKFTNLNDSKRREKEMFVRCPVQSSKNNYDTVYIRATIPPPPTHTPLKGRFWPILEGGGCVCGGVCSKVQVHK